MLLLCKLQFVVKLGELGLQQRFPGNPIANCWCASARMVLDVFLRYPLLQNSEKE